ncbi:MAG: hypothetical protein LBQ55_00870 [Treponema sp.]|nr:hypothetical protein [Treponema sp.]
MHTRALRAVRGNTAGYYGGGVLILDVNGATFIKTGGTIYGDTNSTSHTPGSTENTALNPCNYGSGHAVYTPGKYRNTDAGPLVHLYAYYDGSVWTYDGTSVDGINMDTTPNWTNP